MNFIVVSEMVDDDGKLLAYMLVSESGRMTSVTVDKLIKVCESCDDVTFLNAVYDKQYKILQGIGEQLSNYPKVNKDYVVVGKNGLTIMATVIQNDEPVGVLGYNALGTRFVLSYEKFVTMTKRYKETNYSLEVVGNKLIPVPKQGVVWGTVTAKDSKKKKRSYNSGLGEQADDSGEVQMDDSVESKLSVISPSLIDDISATDLAASAQKKMLLAKVNIAKLAPYYSCIYESLEKRAKPGLGTLGVTEDTLYYDLEFPASLSVAELSFVLLHEVCHVVMQHSIRRGERDPELWNIATDLYINSILCRDFQLDFKGGANTFQSGEIKTPYFGVYLESINETIDFAKDSPESIYSRLRKDIQSMPPASGSGGGKGDFKSQSSDGKSNKDSGGDGDQNNGKDGQGSQGSQGQGSQGQNSQGQDGSSSSENSNPFEEQGGNSQGGSNQGGSGNDDGNQNGSGSGNDSQTGESADNDPKNGSGGADEKAEMKTVSVTYNGKKLTGRIMTDIHTKDNSDTKEGKKSNLDASKNALQRAKTKIRMTEEKLGSKLDRTTGIGQGGSLVDRHIEFGLAEGIDWRQLMKNIAVDKPKKMYTLAMPNQDYMSMNMTVAERRRIGKPTEASKFVVAIDVSGSVSEAKLNYFLSEVNTLTKRYKVTAELVYWSTTVGDAGSFSSMKDLLRVQPVTTGGTDVRCVFEYLTRQTTTETGKQEPLRVKDILGVFIITDGWFHKNYGEYEQYFGSKTVWLIDGNPVTFDAMFGRVLGLECKED